MIKSRLAGGRFKDTRGRIWLLQQIARRTYVLFHVPEYYSATFIESMQTLVDDGRHLGRLMTTTISPDPPLLRPTQPRHSQTYITQR